MTAGVVSSRGSSARNAASSSGGSRRPALANRVPPAQISALRMSVSAETRAARAAWARPRLSFIAAIADFTLGSAAALTILAVGVGRPACSTATSCFAAPSKCASAASRFVRRIPEYARHGEDPQHDEGNCHEEAWQRPLYRQTWELPLGRFLSMSVLEGWS